MKKINKITFHNKIIDIRKAANPIRETRVLKLVFMSELEFSEPYFLQTCDVSTYSSLKYVHKIGKIQALKFWNCSSL